jgi:hypothetical protein
MYGGTVESRAFKNKKSEETRTTSNKTFIEKLIMAEVVAVAADTEAGALLRTVNVSSRKVSLLNAFVVGIGCLRGRGGLGNSRPPSD